MKQADVFRTLLKDIEIYFNKDLTDHQARFYWNECGHWDRPDFERGLKEIMRTKRPIPSNFPTPIELNDIILKMGGKTGRPETYPRTRCHACYDTGYLQINCKRMQPDKDGVQRVVENYEEAWRCGHCKNWQNEDLDQPGFKGATQQWKSRLVPTVTLDQFDMDIVGRYRRRGIEATLVRKPYIDRVRRENDKKFGIKEGMTIEACDAKEQAYMASLKSPPPTGGDVDDLAKNLF